MKVRALKPSAAALAIFAVTPLLIQCDRRPEQPAAPAARPEPPTPAILPTQSSMTRASLLAELDRAAANYAAGAPTDANASIAGKTFTLRLPFGCSTRSDGLALDGHPRAVLAKNGQTMRLTAAPADWTRSPLVLPPGADPPWDKVEGFWIKRPWMTSDACPARRGAIIQTVDGEVAASDPARSAYAPSPPTAGLAVILGSEASRLGRRDARGYEHVVRKAGDAPLAPPPEGYRLVLEGRIATFNDGRAIRCNADSPDRRPACVAAVQLDSVAFEAADGARLSEWRPGG